MDKFHELTNRWIIRREKHEVLKNLPSFRRDYITINIEDQLLRNSYNRELGIANTLNNSGKQLGSMEILGILAKLRRITGMAKIPWCVDYVNEFMTESDEKLALGIHHESVRDNLFYTLEQYSPLKLSGEDSAWRKNEIQNTFNNDPYRRLLIINILAGGVGMNLQGGNNFVCLERQWSSADEEQFESRFHRDGQKLPVSGLYPIAYGTIDQWFHEIVENKRDISKSTLGDSQAPWDITADPTMLKALFEKTLANPLAA
jgi:SNF2 family DNA or RNA helicase